MPVLFDGNQLTPAPFVTINKEYLRDDSGEKIRPQYNITLNGTIVNIGTSKDSPGAQSNRNLGDPNQMEDVLAEQSRIRDIFTVDGGRLEVSAPAGGGPNTIDAYCRVNSVDFDEGNWVNRADYTIELSTHFIEGDNDDVSQLDSVSETWDFNENIDGTYDVTHTLEAIGARIYSSSGVNDPLITARNWCRDNAFSIDVNGNLDPSTPNNFEFSDIISDITSLSQNSWNYSVTENVGSREGSWQLGETWVYVPSGEAVETFSISPNQGQNRNIENISIQGSIVGYADRLKNTDDRNTAASGYFFNQVEPNLFLRASNNTTGGFTVAPKPTSKQVTYNKSQGTLDYNYTYVATSGALITNAVDEDVSINDSAATDVFARLQVPGRSQGPVVQYMNTKTLPQRNVNINATLAPTNAIGGTTSLKNQYLNKPDTDDIIQALKPNAGNYYIQENSEQWNPMNRQYSRSVTWVINPEGSGISGIPNNINNTS